MTDKKISALTASTTPLAGTEVLPVVQGGVTLKVAVSDLTAARAVLGNSFTGTKAYSNTSDLNIVATGNIPGWSLQSSGGGSSAMVTGYIGANISSLLVGTGTTNPTTEALRVTHSDGSVSAFNGDFTVRVGNILLSTAAKGINFTANTPAAGMTSQLLNWYEEGTWATTLSAYSGTFTAASAVMYYIRKGREVTVSFTVTITTNGTANVNIALTVPWVSAAGTSYIGSCREQAATGIIGSVALLPSNSSLTLQNYDNTYPGADGRSISGTLTYFTT